MELSASVLFGLKEERVYIPGRFVKSSSPSGEAALNPGFIDITDQQIEDVGGLIKVGGRSSPPVDVMYTCRPGKPARTLVKYSDVLWQKSEVNIVDSHRFFPLEALKFNEIQGLVNTQHAATFITESTKDAQKFLKELEGNLKKYFKFMFLSKHVMDQAQLNTKDKENLALAVSCINLPFCIPIFDARRANGMGIILSAIIPERCRDKMVVREELCQIVGNSSVNITHVDGASLRRDSRYDSARVGHLDSLFLSEEKRRLERDKNPKAVEGKKGKSAGGMATVSARSTSSSTTNSSFTTSYYFKT